VFLRLDETSSQVRVRLAVMLLLASVVIANRFGFESILGAFLMGAVLAIVARTWEHEERFRSKIEAVGFGVFVPVFFVTSGLKFDLSGLSDPADLLRTPLFVAILLAVHMLPALLFRNDLSRRETAATGLLLATNLSFIVVVANQGTELGKMRQVSAEKSPAMMSASPAEEFEPLLSYSNIFSHRPRTAYWSDIGQDSNREPALDRGVVMRRGPELAHPTPLSIAMPIEPSSSADVATVTSHSLRSMRNIGRPISTIEPKKSMR